MFGQTVWLSKCIVRAYPRINVILMLSDVHRTEWALKFISLFTTVV